VINLTQSHPSALGVQVGRWRIDSVSGTRLLRASLRDALANQKVSDGAGASELLEKLKLVTTELVNNAIEHARTPATFSLSGS